VTINGKRCVVEYEPDSDLRDTETVPLEEPGGIVDGGLNPRLSGAHLLTDWFCPPKHAALPIA
jgi:hypothetical protein